VVRPGIVHVRVRGSHLRPLVHRPHDERGCLRSLRASVRIRRILPKRRLCLHRHDVRVSLRRPRLQRDQLRGLRPGLRTGPVLHRRSMRAALRRVPKSLASALSSSSARMVGRTSYPMNHCSNERRTDDGAPGNQRR